MKPPAGLVLSVTIPDPVLPAGSKQTATVSAENTSEATQSVAQFFGVSVADEGGTIVFDTFDGNRPYYSTTDVPIGPGVRRSREFRFDVPPPGRYRIAGYMMDETTWTPVVEFTSR